MLLAAATHLISSKSALIVVSAVITAIGRVPLGRPGDPAEAAG